MNDAGHQTIIDPVTEAERFDAVVLGAGISGLVSASVLLRQGYARVLIVDEYDHIGGNHIDWSSGGYTFDIGSLIFQDDSPLLDHFPELLPLYVPISPQWARLNPQRMITTYPISVRDDIFGAGFIETIRIFASVIYARLFQRKMRNAKEFARYWIGGRLLHRSGLESYMKRFYGVATDGIDIELARKRMLWISEHASIQNLISRVLKPKQAGPTNRQMARPKEGFRFLYKAAADRLERGGAEFHLAAEMLRVSKVQDQFHLQLKDRIVACDRIISTIPIHRAEELCGLDSGRKLETITLIGLYFSFSGDRGFQQSIIYNFSHEGAWKRLTMYSDFYGRAEGREYFTAEVIGNHAGGSVEQAERDFREHVRANGLFQGDLRLEGSCVLEEAYPIYSRGAAQHAAEAIRQLQAFGLESLGRQGGFNYQPTARASTVEAEASLRDKQVV
ncbi:NAD(P)-binding protein (plasmid) [Rhizobium lusitanum]|uniref:FAD-dependent oxidoreductase n=1 Tax=Rhizobium lusitanum TaxID=293958 RepID=UPI001607AFF7|nr:FAD-dependent oxidoreductase [Rhizobium lusitanum]QND45363.1 NAD(P)-binding protein [Rhizobium lusitanum]